MYVTLRSYILPYLYPIHRTRYVLYNINDPMVNPPIDATIADLTYEDKIQYPLDNALETSVCAFNIVLCSSHHSSNSAQTSMKFSVRDSAESKSHDLIYDATAIEIVPTAATDGSAINRLLLIVVAKFLPLTVRNSSSLLCRT
jgi:hypothetical protein